MFKTQIKVRFNHVDFARIVFYPRYYEMLNQVVEEWCENQLAHDFLLLDTKFNAALPAKRIEVDFSKPSRLGDILDFNLKVKSVGRSAINLTIEVGCEDELRLSAVLTLIYIVKTSENTFVSSQIPSELKELMLKV